LDKARSLLEPIKLKYGFGLSWGDLFILAGTTAIESMGGPSLGVCLGRVDDVDGSASLPLGPTAEQEVLAPCPTNGECEGPLGTTTVGLIYVNPEGPMGKPDPVVSSTQVRDTFARMAMNDTETVALIGGGHAFGKTHGACPESPGLPPSEDEENPWSGNCGSGVGVDAVTSGFEGPWTANPTAWDNYYFKNLLNYDWSVHEGPGGHFQWKVSPDFNATSPSAPSADGEGEQDVMMLTSDISLINDKAYFEIVSEFASDLDLFSDQFAHAWYKLTTRDMGPVTRCNGPATPLAQVRSEERRLERSDSSIPPNTLTNNLLLLASLLAVAHCSPSNTLSPPPLLLTIFPTFPWPPNPSRISSPPILMRRPFSSRRHGVAPRPSAILTFWVGATEEGSVSCLTSGPRLTRSRRP